MSEKDLEFHRETGRIALDLIATLGDRHGNPIERLRNADDLARWFEEVAAGPVVPPPSDRDFLETKRFRGCLARLMDALYNDGTPDPIDVEEINKAAAAAPRAVRLSRSGRVREDGTGQTTACLLGHIARDAIELVTGDDFAKLRLCAAPDCSVFFVDHSRPGKRRWCSMSRCGNKAKKKRFNARHGVSRSPDAV